MRWNEVLFIQQIKKLKDNRSTRDHEEGKTTIE
jgi:hypothetical protein